MPIPPVVVIFGKVSRTEKKLFSVTAWYRGGRDTLQFFVLGEKLHLSIFEKLFRDEYQCNQDTHKTNQSKALDMGILKHDMMIFMYLWWTWQWSDELWTEHGKSDVKVKQACQWYQLHQSWKNYEKSRGIDVVSARRGVVSAFGSFQHCGF